MHVHTCEHMKCKNIIFLCWKLFACRTCLYLLLNVIGLLHTQPYVRLVTSNSISFDFATADAAAFVPGTDERFLVYMVQYRLSSSSGGSGGSSGGEWCTDPPPIHHHPAGVEHTVLNHTINNLMADTEYDVRVAVCQLLQQLTIDCQESLAPVVVARTGEKNTLLPV